MLDFPVLIAQFFDYIIYILTRHTTQLFVNIIIMSPAYYRQDRPRCE